MPQGCYFCILHFYIPVSKIPTHGHTPGFCEGFLVCITVSLAPTFTCLYFYTSHAQTYTILQLLGKYKTFTKAGI